MVTKSTESATPDEDEDGAEAGTALPDGLPDDLPKRKAPAAKGVDVKGIYQSWGTDWAVIRPNQVVGNKAMGGGVNGGPDMGAMNRFLLSYIHPDQRDAFLAAAEADETLDVERLSTILEDLSALAFDDA